MLWCVTDTSLFCSTASHIQTERHGFVRGRHQTGIGAAQVAASAEQHVVVKKALDSEGRALTRVMPLLREEERLAEVAAMMGMRQQEALQVLQASRG